MFYFRGAGEICEDKVQARRSLMTFFAKVSVSLMLIHVGGSIYAVYILLNEI